MKSLLLGTILVSLLAACSTVEPVDTTVTKNYSGRTDFSKLPLDEGLGGGEGGSSE